MQPVADNPLYYKVIIIFFLFWESYFL